MAIGIHVARVGQLTIDAVGNVIDKSDASVDINTYKSTSTEPRVIADESIPTTANNPTVKDYLEAEAANDYVLYHMDLTTIITYLQSDVNNAT